ncbi:MAG: hypothetical protein ACFFE4_07970, partial [Candidatus Thorarchaeota archaeon]
MNRRKQRDNPKIRFLKVKKTEGQRIIEFLKDHFKKVSILDHRYVISYQNRDILFPLVDNQEIIDKLKELLDRIIKYDIVSREGSFRRGYKYKSLKEALIGKIAKSNFDLIPKSYDIIGNIAVLEFNKPLVEESSEIGKFKHHVAKAVMSVNKNVKSVFEKKSEIKGDHRLREYAHLNGENRSETIHKENNCAFRLDIKKTYFSP